MVYSESEQRLVELFTFLVKVAEHSFAGGQR